VAKDMSKEQDGLKVRVAAMSNDEKDDFVKFIFNEAKISERVAKMDNRELLWWVVKVLVKDVSLMGVESHLLTALEDRLFPEYDGEKVQITETGWKTPNGEITYSKIGL
jgi:hypothetical protein